MSTTAESEPVAEPGTDSPSAGERREREEDHAYFRHLEEVFIALRGAPLLLSPEDWRLAREWHREGIPLSLVERTLRDLFARRAAQGKEERVNSLRYCRPVVASAWKRARKLQAAAEPLELPELDLAARLRRLAEALPKRFRERARWQRRIEEIEGDPETVEKRLQTLDGELLAAAAETMTEKARVRLEGELARARSTLAERLPEEEVERALERLRVQLLRERRRLPLLSLFAPEALADEESGR